MERCNRNATQTRKNAGRTVAIHFRYVTATFKVKNTYRHDRMWHPSQNFYYKTPIIGPCYLTNFETNTILVSPSTAHLAVPVNNKAPDLVLELIILCQPPFDYREENCAEWSLRSKSQTACSLTFEESRYLADSLLQIDAFSNQLSSNIK